MGNRMTTSRRWLRLLLCGMATLAAIPTPLTLCAAAQDFDTVILNGRVIDPESNLDAVRHLGISNGVIQAISEQPLRGRSTIDGTGLVVSPGFIDLHQHGQTPDDYRFKAMDGVTTALELEVGTADIDRWYAERKGNSVINFGVSIGHIPVRMAVLGDAPAFLPPANANAAVRPASDREIEELKRQIEHGLQGGAIAVGFGIQYTPLASPWEILEMFRVAAKFSASCHVHLRGKGENEFERGIPALEEVLAAATVTGAPLHVVHIQSTGGRATPRLLQMMADARSHGLDVTTECYPYTAGMTDIRSAIYDEGWQKNLGIDYKDLQWPATGERLTAESFSRYRKIGGLVISYTNPEEIVRAAVVSPLTMIASDGFLQHPRGAGTYSRVLGHYGRELKALALMDGLRKMTILPAQRLEKRAPMMRNKGRIRVGADADLTLFDPDRIIDKSTFEQPARYSEGIKHVFVNGVPVMKDGQFQEGSVPGRGVRAPIQ
jgi:N-acyl-D-aspartate/D-glutamate deacylase